MTSDWRWFVLALCAGLAVSCAQRPGANIAELVTVEKLRDYVNGPNGYHSTVFTGVFYAGSDNNFDYIAVEHRDISTTVFRVRRGELSLRVRLPIASNRKSWVNITREYPPPWNERPPR